MSSPIPDALADLLEISSQIESAVVLGDAGVTAAAGLGGDRSDRFAAAARELLAAAESERDTELVHVHVEVRDGAVFVVCEAGLTIAAVTAPSPTPGLVLYDLRACLRRLAAEASPPKKRRRKPANADAAA
jgi:predicted regulator of Ras-like GTPase activity (Roadblock/LC7/MglB family)